MDANLENETNRIIALGMQQIRMLFAEGEMVKAKQNNELNDEQYDTFRTVADKHWDKWSKKAERFNKRINR